MYVRKTALVAALMVAVVLPSMCLALGWGAKEEADQPPKIIAHFNIGALVETPQDFPPLFGEEVPQSTKELLERFKEARKDDNVRAIILSIDRARLGVAQLEELHEALSSFKAVDKDVYVHTDMLFTGAYTLATCASHISITPTGDVWLLGLYGETPYLKGMLDKIGVIADMEQCGDFKTAAEILTRSGPSPQSEEMTGWLLDGLYDSFVRMIAVGREIKPAKVRALIDGGPYTAEEALEAGLIDSVMHRQDFIADLKERHGESTEIVKDYGKEDPFGKEPDNIFEAFSFIMEILNPPKKVYTEPSVAVIYVEGLIQTGTAKSSPFGGSASGAYSTTIRKALDKAAEDDSVKAVVLRIDSGGGSALASEIMLDASKRVAAKKPLIASMGNVAASGGYYVTCGSRAIFADEATITASIGVIGGKLVTTGGWDKLGINWSAHKRGKMAGFFSSAAPFSDVERAKMRKYIDVVYDQFKDHVVDSRGDKLTKPIDEMAGGRVYTGAQALALGLVDKIGGFEDAVKFAADQANISDYEIRVIPEPPSFLDMFSGKLDDDEFAHSSSQTRLSLIQTPLLQALLPVLSQVDPQRVSAIEWSLMCLDLVGEEGMALVMPERFVIR